MIWLIFACQKYNSSPSIDRQFDVETDLFEVVEARPATQMPTIIELNVETSQDISVWADVIISDASYYSTHISQGTVHQFLLGGAAEEQTISIQLHTAEESSELFDITTERLSFHPQVFAEGTSDTSGVYSTVVSGEEKGLAIWNSQGELLWSLDLSDQENTPIQSHFSPNQGTITYNLFADDHAEPEGELITVNLLGEEVSRIDTPYQHHAFVPIDSSTFAYLSLDVQMTEEFGSVVGDQIILINNNNQQKLFSCWDHFEVAPTPVWNLPFYPQGKDWTHASGLTYNSEEEILTLSLMGLQAILNIDLSGNITNVFGGDNIDSTTHYISDPPLVRPHGAKWLNQKMYIFHSPELQSRGSVFNAESSESYWENHVSSEGIHALALGDIHPLAENNLLVNYGTAGRMELYKENGETVFVIENALGSYFSHATYIMELTSLGYLSE
jgi:hypothetical protein